MVVLTFFKRGLDRNYINFEELYRGIKGKVLIHESIKMNILKYGKTKCSFDDFSYDIIHNQIIKSTLKRLTKLKTLDGTLKKEVWNTYWLFENVSDIDLSTHSFYSVKIHRNNYFYDFLIRICNLIFTNTVLNEVEGNYVFKDFARNDREMAYVFENFVRNFYNREATQYKVSREDILWDAVPLGDSSSSYLPKMTTDISLESSDRKIIIDTKYYSQTLSNYYQNQKIHSYNLYQLYSYLNNIEIKNEHPLNDVCEGILLYPTVDTSIDQSFQLRNHKIRIATVNLASEWKYIHSRLLNLVTN